MKEKIIIVFGDPNSVNAEIIYKCWKRISKNIKRKIYLISNFNLLKNQFKKLKYPIKFKKVKDINENLNENKLKVIDVDLKFKNPFNVSQNESSYFVINSLNLAHRYATRKHVKGIINCSINKNLLNKKKIGVTEYLAEKCKVKNKSEVMLISNNKLSVCPITTHIDINQISKNINKNLIVRKVSKINFWFKKNFKKKPKFAILGLNPHNAELDKNSEEHRIIIPSLKKIKKLGISIDGPFSADTIFINDYKKYNVIIGMYHDQVLGPFKSIFKFDAINITLGLKYARVSPDHGTAREMIGKNLANPLSLQRCIEYINNLN